MAETTPLEHKAVEQEGERITLGGKTFIVPPLCIDQLRLVVPAIRSMARTGTDITAESIDGLVTINYVAISLNYPDLSRDKFKAMRVGFTELMGNVAAIARACGLDWVEAKPKPGDAPPGEAGAGPQATGTA